MNVVITDASFKKPDKATIAMLVGEKTERKKVKAISPAHAELLSIKLALEYLKEKNIKGAVIVNDNKAIVDHLNGRAKIKTELKNIASEVKELMAVTNTQIEWLSRKKTIVADMVCTIPADQAKKIQFKTISLPKLDLLKPTIISTAIKLGEEVGELNQIIGKMQGLSGEPYKKDTELYQKLGRELLDIAQTCITFMFVLEEDHGVSIDSMLKQHINKLKQKGYMS